MTVLITGGTGKLGRELARLYPDAHAPGRAELDLLNQKSVETNLSAHAPDLVFHAAAYTSVADAEKEKEICWNTNVRGTEYLVGALSGDAKFVYVSTACVFYGDRGNYSEEDIPNPKNFYGLTKLVGEYVAKRLKNHLIARTNFVAEEPWPYERAFTDRWGTYLYAHTVARALQELVEKDTRDLLHLAGDKRYSMYELARLTSPRVGRMTMEDTTIPLTVDMTLTSVRMKPYKLAWPGPF